MSVHNTFPNEGVALDSVYKKWESRGTSSTITNRNSNSHRCQNSGFNILILSILNSKTNSIENSLKISDIQQEISIVREVTV